MRHGEDGLLLPMEPLAWSEAITGLLADPERRQRLARAARQRLVGMLETDAGLPSAPAG